MRKLLQNKAVVSALAVIAVLAVGANFVSYPKLLGLGVAAREAATTPAETAAPALHMPPTSRLANGRMQWRELFPLDSSVRDPFAPPAQPATLPPQGSDSSLSSSFVVQAISFQEGKSYAVINRHVLAEGDRLQGHTVERILPASVQLRGPSGSFSVTIDRRPTRQNAPKGKPAPADPPAAVPPGLPSRATALTP